MSIGKSSLKEGLHTPPSPPTAIRSNTSTLPFFGGWARLHSSLICGNPRGPGMYRGCTTRFLKYPNAPCMEYLPTFRPKMALMEVNILYMEHLGYSGHIKSHSLFVEKSHTWKPVETNSPNASTSMLHISATFCFATSAASP